MIDATIWKNIETLVKDIERYHTMSISKEKTISDSSKASEIDLLKQLGQLVCDNYVDFNKLRKGNTADIRKLLQSCIYGINALESVEPYEVDSLELTSSQVSKLLQTVVCKYGFDLLRNELVELLPKDRDKEKCTTYIEAKWTYEASLYYLNDPRRVTREWLSEVTMNDARKMRIDGNERTV